MRIVFFTGAECQLDALFVYMYAQVAQHFPDVHVVAVHPGLTQRQVLAAVLSRYWRKIQRLGIRETLEIFFSYPLQRYFAGQDQAAVQRLLHQLPRPPVVLDTGRIMYVKTVNGPDAIETMRALTPDIIIQAGAGILRPRLFKVARIGTINMHHGIAPLIRGMDSLYWALWEKRSDWIGATVHWIDEGIDTGAILAYAPVTLQFPGESYPKVFARMTAEGVEQLVKSLTRLAAGERWTVPACSHAGVYRSTMSGWKLASLRLRLASQRRGWGENTA